MRRACKGITAQAALVNYRVQPGDIRILGDFNARIACASHPSVPTLLRYMSPTYGEAALNAPGRLLLQFCHDNNLFVMSGSSPEAAGPTCVGHGRGADGTGTSVVDHILGTQTLDQTAPLPRCITLTHAAHASELRGVDSDHCPVLQHIGRGLATAQPQSRRAKSVRLCMEFIHDAAAVQRFQDTIESAPEG